MANSQTNVEFVTDLMDFARSGPLMQAFVIEALRRYANQCAAASPADMDTPGLSGTAWHACATELKAALDQKYGD